MPAIQIVNLRISMIRYHEPLGSWYLDTMSQSAEVGAQILLIYAR